MRTRIALALTLMLIPAWSSASSAQEAGPLRAETLKAQASVKLNYLLYLPEGYDERESWPLMLFLHGGGERGDNLELVKVHGPTKLIAAGKHFPFIVVAPQLPANQWWRPTELTALLDTIERDYKVDKTRIYVTGLSLGGWGTWALALHAPERFAAIAPICGGGETYWSEQIYRLPIWAFHGAKDELVPPQRSQEMVDAIRARGGSPKLTVYPEAAHDSWTETYNNPELYAWLLEQVNTAAD